MTPLYLAVVPGRSGWNQLVMHTCVLQNNVKRTEWNVAFFVYTVTYGSSFSSSFSPMPFTFVSSRTSL